MHFIAVYGSLKKGFYNHPYFKMGEIVTTGSVLGAMYKAGSFPRLCSHEQSMPEHIREHVLEVYEVDDATYESIEGMEVGAGYTIDTVTINGIDCTIFYSKPEHCNIDALLEEYTKETVPSAWVGKSLEITRE